MKLRSLRLETSPRLMIIPMIDIIFFLLVFFMMSTLYMVEQRTLPVELPQAATSQVDMNKRVAITVLADGRVLVNKEEVSPDLIKPRIQAELARGQMSLLSCRADRRTEYGNVVAIMDELKELGVRHLAVATDSMPR